MILDLLLGLALHVKTCLFLCAAAAAAAAAASRFRGHHPRRWRPSKAGGGPSWRGRGGRTPTESVAKGGRGAVFGGRVPEGYRVRRSDLIKIGRGAPVGRPGRRPRGGGGGGGPKRGRRRRRGGSGAVAASREAAGDSQMSPASLASWAAEWLRAALRRLLPRPLAGGRAGRGAPRAPRPGERTCDDGGGGDTGGRYLDSPHSLRPVSLVGLDCEMVGAGRDGIVGVLARCTLVTFEGDGGEGSGGGLGSIGPSGRAGGDSAGGAAMATPRVRLLYDAYVRPTQRVTDYRTRYSGITRDTFRDTSATAGDGSGLPVVSFEQCRRRVALLLKPVDGGPVVVVGHALRNDFGVLRLRHPPSLTRDTATYRPLMREGRSRSRPYLAQKLSHLAQEELGWSIQTPSSAGHSSAEDAAAALLLYWRWRWAWERSLGHPLRAYASPHVGEGGPTQNAMGPKGRRPWGPLTLYLDGCNLPLSVRQQEQEWKIISRVPVPDGRGDDELDWVPLFRSAMAIEEALIDKVVVFFDGSKYRGAKGGEKRPGNIIPVVRDVSIVITEVGIEVDNVLVERCIKDRQVDTKSFGSEGRGVALDETASTIDEVISLLERATSGAADHEEGDILDSYVVITRNAGGTKTNRRLFDALHLRRPDEGAHCLTGLTARLRQHGLQTARELRDARGAGNVVQCVMRKRGEMRSLVVTDDVLLADRVVKAGALVLNYRQMQQMF